MRIYCDFVLINSGVQLLNLLMNKEEVLLLLLALIIALVLFYNYRHSKQQQSLFTHLKLDKTLTFLDSDGKIARLSTTITSRANHAGLTQMWFRNINADGQIDNILVDGKEPAKIRRVAGSLEVCKEFSKALRRGEIQQIELSYELRDSFRSQREGMTHVTSTDTAMLIMRVRFHPARSPSRTRAFVGYGSGKEEILAPLNVGNSEVSLEIRKPRLGAYYTIEWDW